MMTDDEVQDLIDRTKNTLDDKCGTDRMTADQAYEVYGELLSHCAMWQGALLEDGNLSP